MTFEILAFEFLKMEIQFHLYTPFYGNLEPHGDLRRIESLTELGFEYSKILITIDQKSDWFYLQFYCLVRLPEMTAIRSGHEQSNRVQKLSYRLVLSINLMKLIYHGRSMDS